MEEKKASLGSHALNIGILTGVILIVFSLLTYIGGIVLERWTELIGALLLIAGILYGGFQYRNKITGGYLDYGKALGHGVLVSVYASIISAIFSFLV